MSEVGDRIRVDRLALRVDEIEDALLSCGLAECSRFNPERSFRRRTDSVGDIPMRLARLEERMKPCESAPNPVNKAPVEARVYISVPTQIRAMQWTGDNAAEIAKWTSRGPMGLGFHLGHYASNGAEFIDDGIARLWVEANKKWLKLDVGDWVAQDQHGFYPIKADVFQMKYREFKEDLSGS